MTQSSIKEHTTNDTLETFNLWAYEPTSEVRQRPRTWSTPLLPRDKVGNTLHRLHVRTVGLLDRFLTSRPLRWITYPAASWRGMGPIAHAWRRSARKAAVAKYWV